MLTSMSAVRGVCQPLTRFLKFNFSPKHLPASALAIYIIMYMYTVKLPTMQGYYPLPSRVSEAILKIKKHKKIVKFKCCAIFIIIIIICIMVL